MAASVVKGWYARVKFVLALALITLPVQAAYLKNVPQTLTQPDGQVLHCFASGDEFHHWLHDANGYPITRDPDTGFYVYAVQAGDGMSPTGYLPGMADPGRLGFQRGSRISPERLRERRVMIRAYGVRIEIFGKQPGTRRFDADRVTFPDDDS